MVVARHPVQCGDGDHEVKRRPRPEASLELGDVELAELLCPEMPEGDVVVVLKTLPRALYEREGRVDADHRAARDQARQFCGQIPGPAPDVENVEVRQY